MSSKGPTVVDVLRAALPLALFVPVAGPPAIFLVGPLLLLVLLLIPPAALLITFAVALLLVALALFVLGVLIASPYLLVRHLHGRKPTHSTARVERAAKQPGGSGVIHLKTR